jgi:hypothetical protein
VVGDEIKPWQAVNRIISDMRDLERSARLNADSITDLLMVSLRHVSPYKLARLKTALGSFNAQKKEWKP